MFVNSPEPAWGCAGPMIGVGTTKRLRLGSVTRRIATEFRMRSLMAQTPE
jgi:hypothetical protein